MNRHRQAPGPWNILLLESTSKDFFCTCRSVTEYNSYQCWPGGPLVPKREILHEANFQWPCAKASCYHDKLSRYAVGPMMLHTKGIVALLPLLGCTTPGCASINALLVLRVAITGFSFRVMGHVGAPGGSVWNTMQPANQA